MTSRNTCPKRNPLPPLERRTPPGASAVRVSVQLPLGWTSALPLVFMPTSRRYHSTTAGWARVSRTASGSTLWSGRRWLLEEAECPSALPLMCITTSRRRHSTRAGPCLGTGGQCRKHCLVQHGLHRDTLVVRAGLQSMCLPVSRNRSALTRAVRDRTWMQQEDRAVRTARAVFARKKERAG